MGQALDMQNTVKYPEVVFDNKMNFVEHVKLIKKRAQRLATWPRLPTEKVGR